MKRLEDFTDKDVIHCPTEELANKICKLLHDKGFTWYSGSSYIGHNNWRTYQEETCYWVLKGEYSPKNFYENEGCTIYKAEDILTLYEEKQMKQENIEQYYGKQFTNGKTVYTIEKFGVDSIKIVWGIDNLNKDWRIITNKVFFENLEKQIYTMLETQKIIGYKCPISLFNGEVEKGTLFVKLTDTMYEAQSTIKEVRTMKFLPKEIVETWEAIYKDEFKVGDWIYFLKSYDSAPIGHIAKIISLDIENAYQVGLQWLSYSPKQGDGGGFRVGGNGYFLNKDFRKATQSEIDSLFTKTLTLSNGKEVIVNKGIIKPEGVGEIDAEDLTNLIKNWIFKVDGYTTTVVDITFNIGCWKNVKLIDIQNILLEVERQKTLMS